MIKAVFAKQELDIESIQQGITDEHARNVELKHHLQNAQTFKQSYLGALLKVKEKQYDENILAFRAKLTLTFKNSIIEAAKEKRNNDILAAEARKQAMIEEQVRIAEENKDKKKNAVPSFIFRSETGMSEGPAKGGMESLITTTGPIQRGMGATAQPPQSGLSRMTEQAGFARGPVTEQSGFTRRQAEPEQSTFGRGPATEQSTFGRRPVESEQTGFVRRTQEPGVAAPSRKTFQNDKIATTGGPSRVAKKEDEKTSDPVREKPTEGGTRFKKY